MTDAFQPLCSTAGLPAIRLHDLRHTAASIALQAGVPMKVVSEMLGHNSLAITADTYTSVLPVVAQAGADAVAGTIPRAWTHQDASGDTNRTGSTTSEGDTGTDKGPDAAPLAVREHQAPEGTGGH